MTEAEMLYNELLEMFEDGNYSIQDIKTHIYCLLTEAVNHPQNAVRIITDIEEERLDNNLCPRCNGELESIPHQEHSEYQGSDCFEITYSQKCIECDWDSDKD